MGYVIWGVFFQVVGGVGIAFERGEGKAMIQRATIPFRFAGSFCKSNAGDTFAGILVDRFGESRIVDVHLTETEFSFKKGYLYRNDDFRYRFKKNGDRWEGTWTGQGWQGLAECVIAPVPDALFKSQMFLGENFCHECGLVLEDDPGDVHRIHP